MCAPTGLLVKLMLEMPVRLTPAGRSPSQQERTRSTRSLSTPTARSFTPLLGTRSESGIWGGKQTWTLNTSGSGPHAVYYSLLVRLRCCLQMHIELISFEGLQVCRVQYCNLTRVQFKAAIRYWQPAAISFDEWPFYSSLKITNGVTLYYEYKTAGFMFAFRPNLYNV